MPTIRDLVLALVVVPGVLACKDPPRLRPDPTGPSASSTPPPLASAAPGEEIGVFVEAVGNTRVFLPLFWPTTKWQPCRALARAASPPQTGFVEMNLTIDEGGVVTKVDMLRSEGLDAKIVACVQDGGRQSKFGPPDGATATIYAYVTLR